MSTAECVHNDSAKNNNLARCAKLAGHTILLDALLLLNATAPLGTLNLLSALFSPCAPPPPNAAKSPLQTGKFAMGFAWVS